jgi:hypothetical protein
MRNLIKSRLTCNLVVTLVLIFAIREAASQTPGAVEQVDSERQRRAAAQPVTASFEETGPAPELFPAESSDVGPQSILKLKPRKTLIEALADVQYFHTDNMLLTEQNKQEAEVLLSTAQIALAPTAYELGPCRFSPRIGYRHQWYDFGLDGAKFRNSTRKLNEFDFNASTAFADAQWAHEDWICGVGFDFTRLLTTSDYDEFYKEYVPRWRLQRIMPLDEKTIIAIGYDGDYRFSEGKTFFAEDFNDRTDHAVSALCTLQLCRYALLQPYYRFKYTYFTSQVDRQDYLHSVGAALYCFFTPQISLRAFVGYDWKKSDGRTPGPEYDQVSAGGGVNLTFRF